MPLRWWRCPRCKEEYRTKRETPLHCDTPSESLITAPQTKFMEKTDPEKGKSALVGQQKILKERARSYSRDHELDDLIQKNPKNDAVINNWVNKDGIQRKKVDDL